MQGWFIVIIAVAYVTLLFAIASLGDRRSTASGPGRARPFIYALSLAIYCTSWTFFGSVGLSSERGLEFLGIYTGPVLVFVFGFPLLNRIVRLAKSEKITSIADFLGARYGKSFAVSAIATLIATIGAVPYIALQLKAISGSVGLMVEHYTGSPPSFDPFVSGPGDMIDKLAENSQVRQAMGYDTSLATWLVLTCLSGFAIIMLPRQFYVTIVENRGEAELRTATWVFPLYLVAINLFVLPIAFAGLALVGTKTTSDLYVLALPLFGGHDFLAMAAFIGGLSAATAMVIVESVALSIMISNDLVIPLFVRRLLKTTTSENEDWSTLILNVRRGAIFILLFIAFLYYRESTNSARLSSIGLMSFAAIAQFAPALIGGLIWRGANGRGAALGMVAGILVWGYTLLLPSLSAADADIVVQGLFGFEALRPQALFGTVAEPLNHGVLWSLSVNTLFFVLGSLSRASVPLERIQASIFVPRESGPMPSLRRFRTAITVNVLKDTISRYLGVERTERSFQSFEKSNGVSLHGNEQASMDVIRFSEQLLASAVGSSSARLILSLLFRRNDRESKDAFRLLDDATEALQHNRDLLQIALDQMEQGITVFDRDFRLICWNRQYRALFDLPDEMGQVGVSLDRILRHLAERGDIPADQRVAMLNRLTSFVSPWQMELKTSGRILELRSNPMPDGGIVATYADISGRVEQDLALKRANESLEQRVKTRTIELTRVNEELAQAQMLAEEANLGKTRFLAAAGHDILQPLNAARLYCSSLIEKAGKGPAGKAAVNIESSLESVETILGAVLDISRLDAGAMKPDDSAFRLDGLLRQIGNDFQPLAAEKKLDLTIMASSLSVMTDRNLLRRLIQNLVSNAIKYTPHGRILVGVRRHGELAEIQVIDTGIGIAGDKLNTVFNEFTRLDEGVREAEGLGLGLSIVDRIARVLRLEIQIFSNPGKGTRFSVILPVAAVEAPRREVEPKAPARTANSLAGLRVMCIDNDARILDGMRLLLEGWGCSVGTFSGLEDFDRADRPDIVLADYHLDGRTGLDMIARLRDVHGRDLSAVLVTADRSTEVRTAAAALDVPVINKPLKPAVLRSMMARVRPLASAAE
ncbi:hybrid sensor histidine kinase/response regulator [Mesorhizobium sp. M0155]|uniref:PAS domain-containing hybrid sensor histidine kinase/response regulator n=1 Tax=Mesorhizobium sp. M0155 TaxID=2956899 RepID=UPI00333762FA